MIGAGFGWVAGVQTSHQSGDSAVVLDAARAEKAAASRAAVQAEGWARVANGAYTLAKFQNDQAQAARKQAREFADRAEKAAGRATATVARIGKTGAAPKASPAPAVARATPAPRPRHLVAAATIPARASDESCSRAAIYERTAANPRLSRQAAYNASMSGMAVNAHCSEPERSLIGAYLLAQRAAAESALSIGDWKSDLARSDRVLGDCVRHPEHYGALSNGCRQRVTKNVRIRQTAAPHSTARDRKLTADEHGGPPSHP